MSGNDSVGKIAIVVLGLVVILLSAGFIWMLSSLMSKLELSATQVKDLQDQMDSLESRLAKLEDWLQGNITYYNSQIKNLTSTLNAILTVTLQEPTPTQYEKIEFKSAYATTSAGGFTIHFSIKNTGTATATIESIFINGIPLNDVDAFSSLTLGATTYTSVNISDLSYPLAPGNEVKGTLTLTRNQNIDSGTATSGITIEIMTQTAAGNQFFKSVTLP